MQSWESLCCTAESCGTHFLMKKETILVIIINSFRKLGSRHSTTASQLFFSIFMVFRKINWHAWHFHFNIFIVLILVSVTCLKVNKTDFWKDSQQSAFFLRIFFCVFFHFFLILFSMFTKKLNVLLQLQLFPGWQEGNKEYVTVPLRHLAWF